MKWSIALVWLCCLQQIASADLIVATATGQTNYVGENHIQHPTCFNLGDTFQLDVRFQTDARGRVLFGNGRVFKNGEFEGTGAFHGIDWPDYFSGSMRYIQPSGIESSFSFGGSSLIEWHSPICFAHIPASWSSETYYPGDANVDGLFNSSDLIQVFQDNLYEQDVHATWEQGDWTADGRFTSDDLVVAMWHGRYERPAAHIIPESSTIAGWLMSIVMMVFRLRFNEGTE